MPDKLNAFPDEEEITARTEMPVEMFHRHQTLPPNPRDEADTQSECPVDGCVGGEIRAVQDDGHRYMVSISTCSFCQGLGLVPPFMAASYIADRHK